MTTVLLTLGRLPKALALARACHRAGCRVIVAEPFRWHLCRPSRAVAASYRVTAPNVDRERYFDELLEIVRRDEVDLLLPVSEEALHVAALAERLPPGVRLLSADQETLASLHDKRRFAAFADSLGLPIPETYAADSPEARRLAGEHDYVEKPAHSCSGIGLRIARAGEPLASGSPEVLVQRYLPGAQLSTLSLVQGGRERATVIYRGTVFAGTVAVCFERVEHAPAVQRWVSGFIEACPDYSGFIAFDFVVDDDGVARALECNPRATSGIHFLDPLSLGRALLMEDDAPVNFTPRQKYQWAYSTLTEAYASLLRPREFLRRMRELASARDVVWDAADPLPFLLMTPLSWEILWPAMTTSMTLGEATQRDIAWFGSAGA